MHSSLRVLGSLLLWTASAWNTDVHNQIGFMAETFLTPHAVGVLRNILEPQYNGSIGRAAAWADAYAHTNEGHFSYQWHWIDSEDSPPLNCSLQYERDCSPGGCVVSAIANQTEILRGCIAQVKDGILTGGSNLTCSYALKWISHYLGDITQPLHASGLGAGGNLVNVTYGQKLTELHAVWDGYIVYTDAGVTRFSNLSIAPFMSSLVARIESDTFMEPVSDWLNCVDPSTAVDCAMSWARESNAWTCNYVYAKLVSEDLLSSGYAEGAFPIVELQISKAAIRLANWLNLLSAGDDLQRDLVTQTNPKSWGRGPSGQV